jgi:hypothetical protein
MSLVDGPRGGFQPEVLRVRRVFLRARVSICFVRHFWSLEVCRTVREVSADGLIRADGLRVGADGPLFKVKYWKFVWLFQTVRPGCADCLTPLLLDCASVLL